LLVGLQAPVDEPDDGIDGIDGRMTLAILPCNELLGTLNVFRAILQSTSG
jgi:hypothetical protein